jgi:hypothetical protein
MILEPQLGVTTVSVSSSGSDLLDKGPSIPASGSNSATLDKEQDDVVQGNG